MSNTSAFQPHNSIQGVLYSKELNDHISAKIMHDHGIVKGYVNYSTTDKSTRFSSTGATIEYTSHVTHASPKKKRSKQLGTYKLTATFNYNLDAVTFKVKKQT